MDGRQYARAIALLAVLWLAGIILVLTALHMRQPEPVPVETVPTITTAAPTTRTTRATTAATTTTAAPTTTTAKPTTTTEAPTTTTATEPKLVSLGTFKVTHYCACTKCCGKWAENRPGGIVYTASGAVAEAGRTIAVDPAVIPYGTELLAIYPDGTEARYVAQDCGSGVDDNHIDVYMDSHEAAKIAGLKTAELYIVKE